MPLPPDPIRELGLDGYGHAIRRGEMTIVSAVEKYLERIALLNPVLAAYVHVDAGSALDEARRLDRHLALGHDPGPLLGVPVGIKDIVAVDGMPTEAGSRADLSGFIGGEGRLVGMLRKGGCVVLGKLATAEFALGNTGINPMRGTPRNPHDATVFRVPGGSSSGCGVALAAGLCGLAVGTDTGGSIRNPASFCGTFGHKTTVHALPMDGIFSVSPSFDSIGLMTGSAADGQLAWHALTQNPLMPPLSPSSLRLGYLKDLSKGADETVAAGMDAIIHKLRALGAQVMEVSLPDLRDADEMHGTIVIAELIRNLGSARLDEIIANVGGTVAERLEAGRNISAEDYHNALSRLQGLRESLRTDLSSFDALIAPTKKLVAPIYDVTGGGEDAQIRLTGLCGGNTRLANSLGFCATSQPLPMPAGSPPAGLQLMAGSADGQLLAIACAVEGATGAAPIADLAALMETHSRAYAHSLGNNDGNIKRKIDNLK